MNKPTLQDIGSTINQIGLYQHEVRDAVAPAYLWAEPLERRPLENYGSDWDEVADWFENYKWPTEKLVIDLVSSTYGYEVLDQLNIEVGQKGYIEISFNPDSDVQ